MDDLENTVSPAKQKDLWKGTFEHYRMLSDSKRTIAYKKAIERSLKRHDVVLDLGCGTGILSFFAAKKGCQRVYALDNSEIINDARNLAEANNLQQKIKFVHQDVFSFVPEEKISFLLHEQIGGFLWDEKMIEKVVYFREHFLRSDARIMPQGISLMFAPSSYKTEFQKQVNFFDKNHYNINLKPLCLPLLRQSLKSQLMPIQIYLKNQSSFIAPPGLGYAVDFYKDIEVPGQIDVSFNLKKGSFLRGMCLFFLIHLDADTVFSTGPRIAGNHWGQVFLPYVGEKYLESDCFLHFRLHPHTDPLKWRYQFRFQEIVSETSQING